MSLGVVIRVRSTLIAVVALLTLAVPPALAQTTVVLDAPDSEVVDTTIRGGSSANTNFDKQVLVTRASDNPEYDRRALLKFDTETTISERATIQSATLTLTVKQANPTTRTISAYRTESSWDEPSATWKNRRSSSAWDTAGSDLAGVYATASAGSSAGSKVTFNITRLVQEAVNGDFGSRYTRVTLVDDGGSTNESYHEYYQSEASDASVRPKLTVVVGGSSSTSSGSTSTTTTSTTTSTSGTSFKLLQWNVHHGGIGTDGRYDPARVATWIAKMSPDVASLNEVDTTDQVNAIVSALKSKTGVNWYISFSGLGNLMISRLPLTATSNCPYATSGAYAPQAGVVVNGRAINVWSAHLSVNSASDRLYQTKTLQGCAANWSQARILAGDYNMQAGSAEYNASVQGYLDTWLTAKNAGTATTYPGNCDGCTRNSRIDYIFTSGGATFLAIKSAQIVDTRDSSGYMPSDHKPLLVTYTVK